MGSEHIQIVGVVGAGQMGLGIAQVLAHHGKRSVILQDIRPDALDKARQAIETSLARFVSKQQLDEVEKTQILGRIQFETSLDALSAADLAIEAIIEQEAPKQALFRQLDQLLKPHAILASNTSSISITRLASVTERPGQVIGMHFMNPVPLMKLVEVIRGAQTQEDTVSVVRSLAHELQKTTVLSQDFPGFIANRILMPLINEAIFIVYEGVGSVEDIDIVMKLGMNHPMGPLTLADFIGLDTVLSILNVLFEGFGDARFRPCPLLKQYVDAGYLGKKSGRGFYRYE